MRVCRQTLLGLLVLLLAAACGSPTPPPPPPTLAVLPTFTRTLTDTPAPTSTFTWTPSPTPTDTATFTPTLTYTPSYTPTPSHTLTPSATATPIYAPLGVFVSDLDGAYEAEFISGFERHVYAFEGRAGDWVTLTMRSDDPAVDPALVVYGALLQPVAMDDDSGEDRSALLRGVQLPESGTYFVQAAGGGIGRYVIRLLRSNEAPILTPIPPPPTPTLPAGSITPAPQTAQLRDHAPISAVLEGTGFDRYFIHAAVGDLLTIGAWAVAPSANLRLELYNPAGEIMVSLSARDSAANGDALIPAFGLIETGTYTVIVTDDANIGGAYTISYGVDSSHTDILRGVALPDVPVRGDVWRRGWRDGWSLYLNEGDRIAVDLQVDNSLFVAAYEVRSPDGTPLAGTTTDFNAGMSDLRAWISGWYTIRVYGAFARTYGSYTLTWRLLEAAPTPTLLPGTIPILTAEDSLPTETGSGRLYPFQGRAGDRIRIRVVGLDGFDPVAALVTLADALIAESDDADGLNPLIEVTLPADGTYIVRVSGYGGASGTMRLIVERLG